MYLSTIRFLSFSSLLFLLGACGSLPDLTEFDKVPAKPGEVAQNPYFSEGDEKVFKADISIYKNEFTGIFVHRKMNDTIHRIALLSEFGKTLFDLSYSRNFSKLNYSIPELDRSYIITILADDFRLLTISGGKVGERYESTETEVLKTAIEKGFVYYYFKKESQDLIKLTKTSAKKEKVNIYFTNFKNKLPETIQIVHSGINLTIVLNAIPQAYVD